MSQDDKDRNPKENSYDGEQFSKDHNFAGYFKTSAKDGVGINNAIDFLVEKVSIRYIHSYS